MTLSYILALFSASVLSGLVWSKSQRLKAVREEFNKILAEVREERRTGELTTTVFRFQR